MNKTQQVLAVTGAKGGVGKTLMALRLLKECSMAGHKTLLIDCDWNLSNSLIKLNILPNNNFYDLLMGKKSFFECLHRYHNGHILPALNGHTQLLKKKYPLKELIFDIIDEYKDFFHYFILDLPSGLDPDIVHLTSKCHKKIFLITPDKSSLTDSYSLMKVLKMRHETQEFHMIINRVRKNESIERIKKSMSETVKNYLEGHVDYLGYIPEINKSTGDFDGYFLNESNHFSSVNFSKLIRPSSDRRLG
jgi:flagellar biosynthesis protein FlhG